MTRKGEPPIRYCWDCLYIMLARLKTCPKCGAYLPYKKEVNKENDS